MKPYKKTSAIACLALLVVLLVQCNSHASHAVNDEDDDSKAIHVPQFSQADVIAGKAVAAQYCASCHQLPTPDLLNKNIWTFNVLPVMGQYFGIPTPPRYHTPQLDRAYIPAKPTLTPQQWRLISAYYIANAPARMPALKREEPLHNLPFFDVIPAPVQFESTQAFTSCVKIDTDAIPHRLVISNGLTNELMIISNKLQKLNSVALNSAIVSVSYQNHTYLATAIGNNLQPNDLKNGSVTALDIDAKGTITPKGQSLFVGLNRPLSADRVDIDGDGKPDYLLTQFGKMTGALSWFKSGDTKSEHSLRNKPGCMKVIIDNRNNNKGPDLWALFAQGNEGIFHYTNKGHGVFEEKKVLSFPPSYGSIAFDMVDFNGDGYKDIVYACGDNADFSQTLKPYHGVYVYLNDGKNNFSQKYFYPIHGCNKAIALDFDGDGDLDIATVSEYPGTKTPWEAFIYLENKGNFKFQAYTMPLNTRFTRGMTMDAADINGDHKPDLLLGAGYAAENVNGEDKQPLFVVLINKGIKLSAKPHIAL